MPFEKELAEARRIASESGILAQRLRDAGIAVEIKPDASPVTNADRECERLITTRLAELFPNDGIVGEEGAAKPSQNGRRWIIDPIDGTRDYVRGTRLWAVLLALEVDHTVEVGVAEIPGQQESYYAARGLGSFCNDSPIHVSSVSSFDQAIVSPNGMHRMAFESYGPRLMEWLSRCWAVRSMGGCLDAMQLASGKVDIWIERKAEIWDLAPLQVIIEEAGGRFFAADGSRKIDGGSGVACAPGLENEVRRFLANA